MQHTRQFAEEASKRSAAGHGTHAR